MKNKHFVILFVIALLMIMLIGIQLIWVLNMYQLHKQELKDYASQTAEVAVLREIAERTEEIGGYSVYSSNLNSLGDTARFLKKKVTTEDSTYTFTIDKNDVHTMDKIIQFVLKSFKPVNLNTLDSLFCSELSQRYKIGETYFDYIDLEKGGTLIQSNKPKDVRMADYLATDTIPLDIIKTVGVIGYVQTPDDVILRQMAFQLLLSAGLILLCMGGLFYVGKSFAIQWKTEKLRQSSVNAMTHEFKRPISGAVAMVSIIPFYVDKNNLTKVKEFAGKTMIELNKLTAYTKRIQQISNNEKGNVTPDKVWVEIIPFITSVIEKYQSDESKELTIVTNISTVKKSMEVDVLHFSNVLDNLVENAIKYSGASVAITLEVYDVDGGLGISVADNGAGIPSGEIKYIFDKFYRGRSTLAQSKAGFGLGLTYVKSIVESHGGTIAVESEQHKGSRFIIFLPT